MIDELRLERFLRDLVEADADAGAEEVCVKAVATGGLCG